MSRPSNSFLHLYNYDLHLPFVEKWMRHWYTVQPPDPLRRRLLVFLWMFRLRLSFRSEQIDCNQRIRGFSCVLWTPFFSIDFCWKYPRYFSYLPLQTSLAVLWLPQKWWNLVDGDKAYQYEYSWVWQRWEIMLRYEAREDGGFDKVAWLEKIPLKNNSCIL